MKILYVISSLRKGGPVNQIYGLIRYLDRREFDPVIVTLSRERANSCRGAFEELGVAVFDAAIPAACFFLSGPRKIKTITARHSPDIIHSHGIRADFLSAVFRRGVPRVSTVHNFPFADYKFTYGNIPGYVTAKAHVKILSRLDAAVACSESISSWFGAASPDLSVRFIRNGVDCASFKSAGCGEKDVLRKKLDIPAGALVFLSAGHLNRRKDPLTLIRAFKKYAGQNDFLLMLGRGAMQDICLGEAGGAGNIRFAGRVDNVSEYMRASDIFVSCSRAEGFPMAVLEAYSSGLFCVLSDIAPHAEAAGMAPGASALFKAGDSESLKTAFAGAKIRIKDFKPDLFSGGAGGRFCASRMSAEYQKLYSSLTEKGGAIGN